MWGKEDLNGEIFEELIDEKELACLMMEQAQGLTWGREQSQQ